MKINPLAVFTSLAAIAAGTFGYVVTQQPKMIDVAKLTSQTTVTAKVETPVAEVPKAAAKVETPVVEVPKAVTKPEQQAAAATPVKPTTPEAIVPSFDTVRVELGGEAVIAGRATPGIVVVAKLNGQVVASTTANADGSFVMIPEKALPAGAGALTLETKSNGIVQVSTQTVAVAVKPKGEGENTVAVITPDAPTKIVQAPKPKSETVTLDTVDYGASGNIQFAGRGTPNSAVRLYVDTIFLGEAKIDAEGKWNYSGGTTIVAGVYTLRVDELAANGDVKSRIESPFKREEAVKAAQAATQMPKLVPAPVATDAPAKVADAAAPVAPQPSQITIQPGDNLWVLSRNVYGFGRQYTVLYEANKQIIKDPSMIFPGQIITAPVAQAQ